MCVWLFQKIKRMYPQVSSTQEPPTPRTLVILPQGSIYQLTPQGSLAPVVLPRSRPLAPKPFASTAFHRAPHPPISPDCPPYSVKHSGHSIQDVLKVPTPSIGSPTISSSKPLLENTAVSSANMIVSNTSCDYFNIAQCQSSYSTAGFSSQAFKPPVTALSGGPNVNHSIVSSTLSTSTMNMPQSVSLSTKKKRLYSSSWTKSRVSWLIKNSKFW